MQSVTPACPHSGLGSSAFARRYLRNHSYFLFLRILRCFSSPGTSLMSYVFAHGCHPITDDGFPHSDICGSLRAYRSPQHFAVCCVLLQFQVPRHPPYALSYLITTFLRVFAFSKVYWVTVNFLFNFTREYLCFSYNFRYRPYICLLLFSFQRSTSRKSFSDFQN